MPYTDDEVEEFFKKDEETFRRLVERVRKHPVKVKPKIEVVMDSDIFRLYALSYNRHNKNGDSVKIEWEFRDKRFEEFLGDNY